MQEEAVSQTEQSPNLVALLRQHQDKIAAAWSEAVRNLPDVHYRQRTPQELRAWASRNIEAVVLGLSDGPDSAMDDYLADVTTTRLQQGFDIGGVIQGLLLLRETALAGIWPDMLPACPEGYQSIAALDRSFRCLIGGFAHLYAEAMQREVQERQRALAIMEERARMARELHDSVTQAMYSIILFAGSASIQLENGNLERAKAHLLEARDAAQETLREMRLLIFELRPPLLEREGLAAAIQARLEAVEARGGLQAVLEVESYQRLPLFQEEELYRIALEALNNTLKHATARRVVVRLDLAGSDPCLEVADDGVGFELESSRMAGGLGLSGMAERAGRMGARLEVASTPGGGTVVRVRLMQPGTERRP